MDEFSFDATQHEPAQDTGEPLPSGWYPTAITGTLLKKTKAGTGTILEVEHTVSEGEFKGRKAWSSFNVRNPSDVAEKIAKEQLSALCHAIGVLKVRAHEQLREKRCLIRLTVKTSEGYDPRNEVKAWKEYAPASSLPSAPRATAKQQPARVPAERTAPEGWQQADDDDLPF